jgi:hypothetical protein
MRDSNDDVAGQSGHIRSLFPLPRMRTEGDVPSCKSPMVNFAASSARAPLLQNGMVADADRGALIGLIEQSVDLGFF